MAGSLRIGPLEAGASLADAGTMLPIAGALILGNGISAVSALGLAGALFIVAGLIYRVPLPVQPIKAAAAIAIATHASPTVIASAGLVLGAILLLIAITGSARLLERIFPKPIIRGNQLGVGLLLVLAAVAMVRKPPTSDLTDLIVTGVLIAIVGVAASRTTRVPVPLIVIVAGIGWSILRGAHVATAPHLALPTLAVPTWNAMTTALTLLVIPQLPLTLGNAVIGTADVEREYYGNAARRVTPRNLLLSCGAANVAVGVLGGMPLCHGSSGATAYYRFGARTGGTNLVIGALLLTAGVVFGPTALQLFGLIPAPVLAALLAYTGVRHGMLVGDQRGWKLWVALAMGVIGGATRNLTIGMAVGLPAYLIFAGGARVLRRSPA
jgi:sulfate permease, SulP family